MTTWDVQYVQHTCLQWFWFVGIKVSNALHIPVPWTGPWCSVMQKHWHWRSFTKVFALFSRALTSWVLHALRLCLIASVLWFQPSWRRVDAAPGIHSRSRGERKEWQSQWSIFIAHGRCEVSSAVSPFLHERVLPVLFVPLNFLYNMLYAFLFVFSLFFCHVFRWRLATCCVVWKATGLPPFQMQKI